MSRKFRTLFAAGTLALLGVASSAHAQTINFNDGTNNTALTTQYAGLGVTFSNARYTSFFGCCGFSSTSTFNQPQPASPIIVTFSSFMSFVSLLGQDVGVAGFQLSAFDNVSGGNLVGSASVFGTGLGLGNDQTLSITASNIRRLEISQASYDAFDGIAFDNLSFRAAQVPEPSSLALVAVGLLGLGGAVRRRRNI